MNDRADRREGAGTGGPDPKGPKKQITIRLGPDVLGYFKQLADETGIPYQTLINLYLRDCVEQKRRPSLKWKS